LTSFKISQLNFDRTGDGENLKNANETAPCAVSAKYFKKIPRLGEISI